MRACGEPGENLRRAWGRTFGEPGGSLGRAWGELGESLAESLKRTWGEPEESLGRAWGEPGENLERACSPLNVINNHINKKNPFPDEIGLRQCNLGVNRVLLWHTIC